MSLNKYMHERNIYKHTTPDFVTLSQDFPELKQFLNISKDNKKGFLNFNDPNAVRTLTTSLLKKDFNLTVELPTDRLAPALPLRLNYILWIEDLLNSFNPVNSTKILDIGTGSACIYPLLGTFINEKMEFIATEKDTKNYKYAKENIERNRLNNKIKILLLPPNERCLLPFLWATVGDTSFNVDEKGLGASMCNPPFYTSTESQLYEEIKSSSIAFSCCGSYDETVSEDGDLGYARKLLAESMELKLKFSWFTIMMGKKKSYIEFIKHLKSEKAVKICSSEFCQGRTTRWGVAWTFYEMDNTVKLPISEFQKYKIETNFKPVILPLTCCKNIGDGISMIKLKLTALGVKFETSEKNEMTITAYVSTWQNLRKRKRAQINSNLLLQEPPISDKPILSCVVKFTGSENKEICANFYANSPSEKETMNSLVVYLKRQFL